MALAGSPPLLQDIDRWEEGYSPAAATSYTNSPRGTAPEQAACTGRSTGPSLSLLQEL